MRTGSVVAVSWYHPPPPPPSFFFFPLSEHFTLGEQSQWSVAKTSTGRVWSPFSGLPVLLTNKYAYPRQPVDRFPARPCERITRASRKGPRAACQYVAAYDITDLPVSKNSLASTGRPRGSREPDVRTASAPAEPGIEEYTMSTWCNIALTRPSGKTVPDFHVQGGQC